MISNPIVKDLRNFLIYILVWLVITSAYVLILIYGEKIDIYIALVDGFIFNFVLAGFGISFWYPAKYISFESFSTNKILISHLIGCITSVFLWLGFGYLAANYIISSPDDYSTYFLNTLGWRIFVGVLFYFLIISFYYLVIYYTNFHQKTIQENELKNLVTEAELKSLKFQINPHFIFNSLNSMSALTTIDPAKARSMILNLAEFLRYTLVNNDRQKNKLSEELNNIKLYLDIEKIRFEDKFDFVDETSPDCKEALVPNMILQPLFENAIKHAVYESLEKVILKFRCFSKDGFLNISLENNFDSLSENKKGSGIGLKNISDRLKLIYGLSNLMRIEKTHDHFKVNLFIPIASK
ncbi:MAG: histidine kinase [Ignavibacteriaceae bacterium]|nr:histidine kinase [Ignavibacteriaceae bacterium]